MVYSLFLTFLIHLKWIEIDIKSQKKTSERKEEKTY